jgi:hypothetical protein
MNYTEILSPAIWPLTFILVSLFILRQIRQDVNPIFKGVIGGLAQHSTKYALAYAMASLYAAAASLQALAEVATQFHWVYLAAAAKVMQPGIVAVIAYITKGPSAEPSETSPAPKISP